MKYCLEGNVDNAKLLNKKCFKKLKEIEKEFDKESLDFLLKRTKENCPRSENGSSEIKNHLKIASEKDIGGGVTQSGICTTGYNGAAKLHEEPYNSNSWDRYTPEGGEGNKFISRVVEFHYNSTLMEIVKNLINKRGL
jgi:hypothetical protein